MRKGLLRSRDTTPFLLHEIVDIPSCQLFVRLSSQSCLPIELVVASFKSWCVTYQTFILDVCFTFITRGRGAQLPFDLVDLVDLFVDLLNFAFLG